MEIFHFVLVIPRMSIDRGRKPPLCTWQRGDERWGVCQKKKKKKYSITAQLGNFQFDYIINTGQFLRTARIDKATQKKTKMSWHLGNP